MPFLISRTKAPSLFFSFLLLVGLPLFSQTTEQHTPQSPVPPAQKAATKPIDGPQLTFANRIIDFGEVAPLSENSGEYVFQNTGTKPLIISDVRSSCGCTAAMPEKTTLAPGEKSRITIKYKASGSGPIKKLVTVSSNDAVFQHHELEILAKVIPDFQLSESYLRFENADRNKAGEPKTVFLTPKDPKSLTVGTLSCDKPYIISSVEPVNNGSQYRIAINYDPTKMADESEDYVVTNVNFTTSSTSLPRMAIPVYIQFRPEFNMVPQRLFLYDMKAGTPVERDVTIASSRNQPFEIQNVTSDNTDVSATITTNNQPSNAIHIRVTDTKKVGYTHAILTVKTGPRTLRIPVRVTYLKTSDAQTTTTPFPPASKEPGEKVQPQKTVQ